jgi:O-antigen ligase
MFTELDRSAEFLAPKFKRADGATLTCLFTVPLMIIPSRLVLRGIPLSLTPAVLVGIGISVCLFFAHFTNTLGVAKGRSAVRTAIIVYLCAVLATYGYTTYGYLPSDERPLTDHSLVNILAVVGIALVVCDGVTSRDRLDFVLQAIAVSGAVVAGIGALQFLIGFDLTKYLALPIFRYGAATSGGIDARAHFRRPAGTTGTPIEFGVVCAMVLPLALHYGFRARERAERAWGWWLCCGLLAAGAMFAISRSAILGLAAGGIILFIGWPRARRWKALLVSVAFLLAMKLVIPGLLGTIYGLFYNFNTDGSVTYRTHDYPVAAAETAKHVWLGRGPGTWYAPKHEVFDNQYLSTLVEGGVIGLSALAGLFLTGIYATARALYLAVDPHQRDLALTLMACLIVPVIGAGTFDLLGFGTVTGLTFVLLGAAGSLARIARR